MDKLIEALSKDPCSLAIISGMIIAFFIIRNNNAHLQKMEEIRIKQLNKVKK